MQALLLATNESTKLRPLTDSVPAALLPIVDRPVIALAVENLARAGVKQLLVCLCHRSAQIAALLGDGGRWGVHIDYIVQPEGRTPAAILRSAAPLLRETFVVLPADVVLDLDVGAVAASHYAHGALATAVLVGGEPPRASGAYLLELAALARLTAEGELADALAAAEVPVLAFQTADYWNPLETFADYQAAQRVFLYSAAGAPAPERALPRVRHASFDGRALAPGIWLARGSSIHPGARLTPPVYLGHAVRIGRGADLGPDSVIGDNAIVDSEATVRRSTVVGATYIGRMAHSDDRIISHTTIIDPGTGVSIRVDDPFLLSDLRSMLQASWTAWVVNRLAALLLLLLALPALLLLALGAWLSAGRPLRRVRRVVRLPRTPWRPDRAEPATISMLTLATHDRRGVPTAFGRWMRRWQIEHLPALWNVLAGDLNLVGVKPLPPEEAGAAGESWQATRLHCPAGLTGPWYMPEVVSGGQMAEVMADVFYAATRTRREAFHLLLRTPGAWVRRCRQGARAGKQAASLTDALYE